MKDSWKIIKECKFDNMHDCVELLLKKIIKLVIG